MEEVASMDRPPRLSRLLSQDYGPGASVYNSQNLEAWKVVGEQAKLAFKACDWVEADRLVVALCELRPDWVASYELRRRTMTHLGEPLDGIVKMLRRAIVHCADRSDCGRLLQALERLEQQDVDTAVANAVAEPEQSAGQVEFKSKVKGVKLLPHEQRLVEEGQLVDVTHDGASAIWLRGESAVPADESNTLVFRPMGDEECSYLLTHNVLPDTQPYQTIVEGLEGRTYAEKYLNGKKNVDSSPTTVVEFQAPHALIRKLFEMQSKNEDGAISHGLGNKGGRGLPLFNASLQDGGTSFRIVSVKRFEKKAVGAFGANRRRV